MTIMQYLTMREKYKQEILDLSRILESSIDEAEEICRNQFKLRELLGLDTDDFLFIAEEAYWQALWCFSLNKKS